MRRYFTHVSVLVGLLPLCGFAATVQGTALKSQALFNNVFIYLISPIITALTGAALVYFFGSVAYFLFQMNNEEARATAKRNLLYGTIGLFIIFSAGGIIHFFSDMLGGNLIFGN